MKKRGSQVTDHSYESTAPEDWERFWAGSGATQDLAAIQLPALESLWATLLAGLSFEEPNLIAVELASGSGSVSKYLMKHPLLESATKVALDASLSALMKTQFDECPVAGSLDHLPFADCSIQLLTSQFGVEYAGLASIESAIECVAPNGYFVFVMHIKDGAISAECGSNLMAIERFLETGFIEAAKTLLDSLWGNTPEGEQWENVKRFKRAVSATEAILLQLPDGQGRDTSLQTYNAIADIVEEPRSFDPGVMGKWFLEAESELLSYCSRMRQMRSVALSRQGFSALVDKAIAKGFHISEQGVLKNERQSEQRAELAFYLVGQRREVVLQ